MSFKSSFVFLLLFITFCSPEKIQNLGGKWLLKDTSEEYVDIEATVPGGIYTDLMSSSIIPDIFYGYGDANTTWVPRTNWTYYTKFTVDDGFLNYENVNIVFEGLDTFASVFINDEKVGESQNMFVQYIFNIKDQLKPGENTIEVRFLSPIEVAANLAEEQAKSYDIPLDCPPDAYQGECHVNMIRKMQASFSWDWGPSFPSVGIWKDLYIEGYNESVVRYIVADVTEKTNDDSVEDQWVLSVTAYLASNARQNITGKVSYGVVLETITFTSVRDVLESPNEYGEIFVRNELVFPKAYVKTWWPNGYGAQDLYDLTVTFSNEDGSETSSKTVRVGFKTIELVQDKIDSGLTFYFKVNGVPIFMKGSNEIPIDILPEKGQNKTIIKQVLKSAQEVNMNMLRVWGGGIYESDYFYDLADEYGLLIWQDFMFACSMYPVKADYLNNVLEEVRHQVKRLKHHVSIALFSGNNENEGALASDWYGIRDNYTLFKSDYVKLYIDTIKVEVDRITQNKAIFISSSPTNGKESESEGYVAENPGSSLYGDVHYYNYLMNPFDMALLPIPRFASEYGYQSLPSIDTLLTTATSADLDINGQFLDHRQHHPGGNEEMKLLDNYQFQLPDESSENYFKTFVYYTQILQAVAIKTETEHYRAYRSILNDKGEGYTMGALYWQLNDVWVAPSWSGVDYTGKWKMLHYYVQDFFAPMIITGQLNAARTLEVYAVSDLLINLQGITAFIYVYKWDSLEPVSTLNTTFDFEASSSKLVSSLNIDDYLQEQNCGALNEAKTNCFIYLSLQNNGNRIGPDNFVFPASLKTSQLKQPKLQITSVVKISNEEIYKIIITTDNIALFVWLDTNNIRGRFSENGFIQVTENRTLYFTSDNLITAEKLKDDLTITNLLDEQYVGIL